MIKFFRKIRQKLLSEHKISQYLLYAIGEIILVVIGILIALQINNWNESRKEHAIRDSNYQQLLEDLDTDSDYIDQKIEAYEENIDLYRTYLDTFKSPGLSMEDVMKNQNKLDFLTTTLRFQNSTMVSMENTGEIKLVDPNLRKKLTAFKRDQDFIMETNDQWNQNYFSRIENAGLHGGWPGFQQRIRNQPLLQTELGIEGNMNQIIWSIEVAMMYKNINEQNNLDRLNKLKDDLNEITELIHKELGR